MKQIGITGGIGSGKSQIASFFLLLSVPVYNSDDRAKLLMNSDNQLIEGIKELFGEASYIDGKIDRGYISSKLFKDTLLLQKMNELVHPSVEKDYKNWLSQQSSFYTIKESALLVETGGYKKLDQLICVATPENIRLQRVLKRDTHRSKETIKSIIRNQTTDEEKSKVADYLIKNDNSTLIIPQLLKLHTEVFMKS